jgi:hypothetical protein
MISHPVKLSDDIEEVDVVIKDSKLAALNRGEISSDPILLDRGFGKPCRIINGNHRIHLARQEGNRNADI